MPQSVEAVEEEREGEEALKANLDSGGPCSDCGDHGLGLQMPSRVRRSEVGEAEEVESGGQSDAGDAVQGRGVPGDLRLVDGEMRGDGALDALFGEDLSAFGLGGCESIRTISNISVRGIDQHRVFLYCNVLHTSAAPSIVPAAPSFPGLPPVADQSETFASKP